MSYVQIRDASWKVSYIGGWCLKYVQDAFGTDHPYPTAIAAWNDNYGGGNHPGELPPAGKTVAVYFTLGNVPAGHVAISLDDGSVASSTQPGSHAQGFIHPNLQNLIDIYAKYNGGCTYLGWSEYVGTVQVVRPANQPAQQGGDMSTITKEQENVLSLMATGYYPGKDYDYRWTGKPTTQENMDGMLQFWQAASNGDDSLTVRLNAEQQKSAGLVASVSDLTQKLTDANAEETDLRQQIATLQAAADKPEPSQPTGQVAPLQDTTTPPDTSNAIQTLIKKIADALVSFFGGKK